MHSSIRSMIVLLVFTLGAIGGLWFYLQPGKATDTLARANADLASISGNLDALETTAAKVTAAVKSPFRAEKNASYPADEGSGMVFAGLSREKCREILPRLLSSSGQIGSSVLLNGQPVKAAQGCRSTDNRIEVVI